ncbi:MAG TPA: RNA polymerase sigma factor [Gemmatimonadota bacterium]|nr:RNA polymerase sigma factor [Gemmatimonadota bacterium]
MDDTKLVELARVGDARAYGTLVERHQTRTYATLRKITGDHDLAMDLTQDAFVRAWRQLGTFEGRAAFSTWLYRIAVRLAYDAIARERRLAPTGSERAAQLDVADPAPGPDRGMERLADVELLERRIAQLPELQRAVVVLRTYDELSYREIAEILDTTEASARVSYHHAITKLRGRYMEEAKSE